MIVLTVTYVIREGHEQEAEEYLRELAAATPREPGCRAYEVSRSEEAPRTFLIYERYDDEAALEAHRASEHFRRYALDGVRPIAESRTANRYVSFA